MGFYYHMFMTTFLPCIYGHRTGRRTKATIAPQPTIRVPFGKIK